MDECALLDAPLDIAQKLLGGCPVYDSTRVLGALLKLPDRGTRAIVESAVRRDPGVADLAQPFLDRANEPCLWRTKFGKLGGAERLLKPAYAFR